MNAIEKGILTVINHCGLSVSFCRIVVREAEGRVLKNIKALLISNHLLTSAASTAHISSHGVAFD